MRCFLAIELSKAAREHLNRVQEGLRVELPKGSFSPAENLHVTLKFLGDVSDRQLPALCDSMQHVRLAGKLALSAARVDFFPSRGLARVIVATMSGSDESVAALNQAIEQRCRKLGFGAESRRYHPHVTLARVRGGWSAASQHQLTGALCDRWPGPGFEAKEFALFESQLGAEGSRYVKLGTFPFAL